MERLKKGKNPKFGDMIENRSASVHNPIRRGVFVRVVYQRGRVNRGKFLELTDTKGYFWKVNPDAEIYVGENVLSARPNPEAEVSDG